MHCRTSQLGKLSQSQLCHKSSNQWPFFILFSVKWIFESCTPYIMYSRSIPFNMQACVGHVILHYIIVYPKVCCLKKSSCGWLKSNLFWLQMSLHWQRFSLSIDDLLELGQNRHHFLGEIQPFKFRSFSRLYLRKCSFVWAQTHAFDNPILL